MERTIKLNPVLFWDIEFSEIDYEKNARQVIERVLTRGSLNDWFEIKSYYGIERIKTEIIKIRSLDKLTLNFCSKYFNIPLEQFLCYNTPQSYQQLWNY
ncbi:MAG: hypothetical protein WCL51_17125 [Bacteroidota bacterium]